MKGNISINRTSRNDGDPHIIHITIEDEISRIEFLNIWLTPEDFGNAVTGLGMQDCVLELRGLENVGREYQSNRQEVRVPSFTPTDAEKAEAVAPYEYDGWKARMYDLDNHHNYTRQDDGSYIVRVVFTRYIDVQPAAAQKEGE